MVMPFFSLTLVHGQDRTGRHDFGRGTVDNVMMIVRGGEEATERAGNGLLARRGHVDSPFVVST
jgi:hypothetical protein